VVSTKEVKATKENENWWGGCTDALNTVHKNLGCVEAPKFIGMIRDNGIVAVLMVWFKFPYFSRMLDTQYVTADGLPDGSTIKFITGRTNGSDGGMEHICIDCSVLNKDDDKVAFTKQLASWTEQLTQYSPEAARAVFTLLQ
jgi:hypothetical protein